MPMPPNLLAIVSHYLVNVPGNDTVKIIPQVIYITKDGYILPIIPLDVKEMVNNGWVKLE